MSRLFPALLAVLLALPVLAQTGDEPRRVVLVDGTILVGTVADETADPLVVVTEGGIEQRIPRSQVVEIGDLIAGRFFRLDPTRTRLLLSPTGRTLGAGRTRVGTLLYVLPQATVGVSDRFDVSGTLGLSFGSDFISLIPVVGGKVGIVDTGRFALAAGANVGTVLGEGSGGAFVATPFAAVTVGDEIRSVSASVTGLIGGFLSAGDVDAADGALLGFGGEIQVNNGLKLLLDVQAPIADGAEGVLIAPGARLFGDQFSVDIFGGIGFFDGGFGGFAPIANFAYTF